MSNVVVARLDTRSQRNNGLFERVEIFHVPLSRPFAVGAWARVPHGFVGHGVWFAVGRVVVCVE